MHSTISHRIAEFKKTRNPICLGQAALLILRQRRFLELAHGLYNNAFCKPSTIASKPDRNDLQAVIQAGLSFSSNDWFFSRQQLIDIFRTQYAIHHLPADFCGTRSESIIWEKDFLIIGEYGLPMGKRLAYVTRQSCTMYDQYQSNRYIVHIHALYKSATSSDILVTTGDSEKRLDLWRVHVDELCFERTLRKRLAGHTAITKVGSRFYMGTDFSSRPNYIERMGDNKKFFFPNPAYKMVVLAFQEYQNRYILAIGSELSPFGKKRALSVFDTATEEFLYCDYIWGHLADQALHKTVIPQRSISFRES